MGNAIPAAHREKYGRHQVWDDRPTESGVAMPDRPEMFAIRSYRYLRLSIIIVTVSLGASIGYERRLAPGFETSISAYFYTPARGIFVGGLVAIGRGAARAVLLPGAARVFTAAEVRHHPHSIQLAPWHRTRPLIADVLARLRR